MSTDKYPKTSVQIRGICEQRDYADENVLKKLQLYKTFSNVDD
jgi:hypothetical protein